MASPRDDELDAKYKAARRKAKAAARRKHEDNDEDIDEDREPRKLEELNRVVEANGMDQPLDFNSAEWNIWLQGVEKTKSESLSRTIWGSGLMFLGIFTVCMSVVYLKELLILLTLLKTEMQKQSVFPFLARDNLFIFLPFFGFAAFSALCIYFGFKLFMTPITAVEERGKVNHSVLKVSGIFLLILVAYGIRGYFFFLEIK